MSELPVLSMVTVARPGAVDEGAPRRASRERERLARRARSLSWLSLGWMGIEGTVAIAAGLLAGSVALVGFGIDSAIEGLASVIVIWRFSGSRRLGDEAELRAQKLVAVSFFLLAPFLAQDALRSLISGVRPAISVAGIALAVGSLVAMPLLGRAKQRVGVSLGSSATIGEGTQNLLCASMAAGVLVGLLANAALGLWWLDPLVALAIAAVAVREGLGTWRGEGCCAGLSLDGASFTTDGCDDDCRAPSPEIASCSLDREGLMAQRDRYAAIGAAVLGVERHPRWLVVHLGPTLDLGLVEETLRIERGCCPFFELDLDRGRRVMTVGVASEEHAPALDAIAHSLEARAPAQVR